MATRTQTEYWLDKDIDVHYHTRQYEQLYRSTAHFGNYLSGTVKEVDREYRVLDLGCGAGANLFHLSRVLPNSSWEGVDISPRLIDLGNSLLAERQFQSKVRLTAGNLYEIETLYAPRTFDIVLSIQTLSWLPDYDQALEKLFYLAKPGGYIFVTSLFTDFHVDARIEVTQYQDAKFVKPMKPIYYNVYALGRFKEACLRLGASDVMAIDFQIDVDLPAPKDGRMGTYTVMTAETERLQFSGPLLMPWKFVAIRVGE
jgi:ubiquinone/menaquinone biosynthesis C-methylase UbiE